MYTEWKIKSLFNHVLRFSLLPLNVQKHLELFNNLNFDVKHRCKAAVYHHVLPLTEALKYLYYKHMDSGPDQSISSGKWGTSP